jgi:hypothetical protein
VLLGLFAAWEINVVVWYLRQYTPAFHLSALATGFVALRYAGPIADRCLQRSPFRHSPTGG